MSTFNMQYVDLDQLESAYAELPIAYYGLLPAQSKTLAFRFSYKNGGEFVVTQGFSKAFVTRDAGEAQRYYNTGILPGDNT